MRNIVGKALQAVAESGDETHCSLLIDVVLKILEEAISHLERSVFFRSDFSKYIAKKAAGFYYVQFTRKRSV